MEKDKLSQAVDEYSNPTHSIHQQTPGEPYLSKHVTRSSLIDSNSAPLYPNYLLGPSGYDTLNIFKGF